MQWRKRLRRYLTKLLISPHISLQQYLGPLFPSCVSPSKRLAKLAIANQKILLKALYTSLFALKRIFIDFQLSKQHTERLVPKRLVRRP